MRDASERNDEFVEDETRKNDTRQEPTTSHQRSHSTLLSTRLRNSERSKVGLQLRRYLRQDGKLRKSEGPIDISVLDFYSNINSRRHLNAVPIQQKIESMAQALAKQKPFFKEQQAFLKSVESKNSNFITTTTTTFKTS